MPRLRLFRIAFFVAIGASLAASVLAIFAASTAVQALHQISVRDRIDASVTAIRLFESMPGARGSSPLACVKAIAAADDPAAIQALLSGSAWSARAEHRRLLSNCRAVAKPDAQGLVAITPDDSKAIVNRATDALNAYNFLFNRAYNDYADCALIERTYRDTLAQAKDSIRFAINNVAAQDPKRWQYPALQRYLQRGCT